MPRLLALLRGINVGGRGRLRMTDLRAALTAIGCTDIQTYIQSGNAVVTGGRDLATALRREIDQRHGFEPVVIVLDADELARVMATNPYAVVGSSRPTSVHVYFLEARPAEDAPARLQALCAPGESFELSGRVLYLHAPEGIGRSRLVKGLDRALGCAATGRNWRTLQTLAKMTGIDG